MPILECPEGVSSDPITVVSSELVGPSLTLEVSHGGGCYGPGFLESYPVQVGLQLIFDRHGDDCLLSTTKPLAFDLSNLGAAFNQAYQASGGLISTTYGLYAFGDATCDERTRAAIEQAQAAATKAAAPCTTALDCQASYIATRCSPGCGVPTVTSKVEHLASVIASIDTHVCGDFAANGCGIQVPPCPTPVPLACVEGRCVEATP
jgi:hypothetical protein